MCRPSAARSAARLIAGWRCESDWGPRSGALRSGAGRIEWREFAGELVLGTWETQPHPSNGGGVEPSAPLRYEERRSARYVEQLGLLGRGGLGTDRVHQPGAGDARDEPGARRIFLEG